jgi:hypothetical protein
LVAAKTSISIQSSSPQPTTRLLYTYQSFCFRR